jgi:hemerythrin-like domain-containing protein
MKRSPELMPLSHDHHQALFAAQQLKRAEDPAEALDPFLAFWRTHGRNHFQVEEEVLLPGWIVADADADRRLAERVLSEHLEIRGLVWRLERGDLPLEETHSLGALLGRHVRFEERELFPAIEAGMDDDAIAELGAEIARAESVCG